jgi:hypothetical protein
LFGIGTSSLFAVACTLVAGCSFIAVTGPPERLDRTRAARCTISPVPPIVDGALAAIGAGVTAYGTWKDPLDYRLLFPIGATLVFASSMIYGAALVGECREMAGR